MCLAVNYFVRVAALYAQLRIQSTKRLQMNNEYIEKREGGYYIAGTQVSIDSVVHSFNAGSSPEAIQESFPLLKLAQVFGAIEFYLGNKTEINGYLAKTESSSSAAASQ